MNLSRRRRSLWFVLAPLVVLACDQQASSNSPAASDGDAGACVTSLAVLDAARACTLGQTTVKDLCIEGGGARRDVRLGCAIRADDTFFVIAAPADARIVSSSSSSSFTFAPGDSFAAAFGLPVANAKDDEACTAAMRGTAFGPGPCSDADLTDSGAD